jgi:hypothetical protein
LFSAGKRARARTVFFFIKDNEVVKDDEDTPTRERTGQSVGAAVVNLHEKTLAV